MYDEIQSQVREHYQDLRGRLEELRAEGYLVTPTVMKRGPFIINIDRGRGHFVIDQIYFAQSEIAYWKAVSERAARGPDQ